MKAWKSRGALFAALRATPRAALFAGLALATAAFGQQEIFPARRINFVIPFATGNGIDQLGRELAEVLRTQINQPVVVDNRDGAASIIGANFVARSAPDGYTMMIVGNPPFTVAPLLQKEPPFDVLTAFTPVAKIGAVPLVAVSAASLPFRNWQEFIAYVRANPDKSNYAASGAGAPGQLYMELVKQQANLKLQEISYKSTAQAMTDTLGGQVQVSLVSVPAAAAYIKAGTLRALAMGSPKRLASMPEVPTLAELLNQPGFEASVWYGVFVPAGTPRERVNKLYQEIAKATQDKRVVDLMARAAVTPDLQDPQQFAESLRKDVELARRMVRVARLTPQ